MGVKSWGVLCLGIHGTWRAGGADAGVEAAGFVSTRKKPVGFLERLKRKTTWRPVQFPERLTIGSQYKRRSLLFPERLARKEGGSVWLVIPLDVKKMESLVGETPGRGRL